MQTYSVPKVHFSFWKKTIFTSVFFILTPIALGASLIALITLNKDTTTKQNNIEKFINKPAGYQIFSSYPSSLPSISAEAVGADARTELIRQYLEKYDSPLEPYASFLVETSDKYKLDYRLLAAIAQQESNLCKKIPDESHNCWGWGIHSRGTLTFTSYTEAIDTVAKGVKEKYVDIGLTTPEEIMGKYTPSSNGSWANGVNLFMNQMR